MDISHVHIDHTDPSFIEKLIINKSPLSPIAYQLKAIEDASEDAKTFIQKSGVFEKILADLEHVSFTGEFERGKKVTYTAQNKKVLRNVSPRSPTSKELAHISVIVPDGGHYSSGVVNPANKTIRIFDSMCSSLGEHDQYKSINNVYKKVYPGYQIKLMNSNSFYQPSGGFCLPKTQLKNAVQKTFKRFGEKIEGVDWNKMYEVSEFDVMSQHHFCYVEAIVFLCKEILGTSLGPRGSSNMSERLVFIKSVLWGLLEKYCFTASFKGTPKYKKLKNDFQYYVDVKGAVVRHGFTIPGPKPTYVVRKFILPTVTKTTSLRDIVNPPRVITPRRLFA